MLSIVASIMDVLGLSSKLNFDSKYMMQMKNEDFTFYGYKQRSNIIFDKTTGNWNIIELLHSNKKAITNASLSPLGTICLVKPGQAQEELPLRFSLLHIDSGGAG